MISFQGNPSPFLQLRLLLFVSVWNGAGRRYILFDTRRADVDGKERGKVRGSLSKLDKATDGLRREIIGFRDRAEFVGVDGGERISIVFRADLIRWRRVVGVVGAYAGADSMIAGECHGAVAIISSLEMSGKGGGGLFFVLPCPDRLPNNPPMLKPFARLNSLLFSNGLGDVSSRCDGDEGKSERRFGKEGVLRSLDLIAAKMEDDGDERLRSILLKEE